MGPPAPRRPKDYGPEGAPVSPNAIPRRRAHGPSPGQLEYPDPTGAVDYSTREPVMGPSPPPRRLPRRSSPEGDAHRAQGRASRAPPARMGRQRTPVISIGPDARQPRHPRGDCLRDPHHHGARPRTSRLVSSYNVPGLTPKQAFGYPSARADENHRRRATFIGKALGEAMKRLTAPSSELMKTPNLLAIYGMAELFPPRGKHIRHPRGGQFRHAP